MTAKFSLRDTYLHLDGERAHAVTGGAEFWRQVILGGGDERVGRIAAGGWLVTSMSSSGAWPTWEMHPAGDEVITVLSGAIEFTFELGAGPQVYPLVAGDTIVIPQGTWHTARSDGECALLGITFGAGTQHRPA